MMVSMAKKRQGGFSAIHLFSAFLAGFALAVVVFSETDRNGGAEKAAGELLRLASSAASGTAREPVTKQDERMLSNDATFADRKAINDAATAILKEVETQLVSKAAKTPEQTPNIEPSISSAILPASTERSFFEIGKAKGTDKVQAPLTLPKCLENPETCTRGGCVKEECRPWGHFYHTMYQQRLGKYSTDDVEPFQFLEIGYFEGRGFDTYTEFLPRGELHSMEISCLPEGPMEEGKWPYGNFASKNKNYDKLIEAQRLHCGDASNLEFLNEVWTKHMKREDAPPLKIVVDDAAHISKHMAISMFFWFPRIAPGGLFVMEDIQPIGAANRYRTQFLPQMINDLHYCGDPQEQPDTPCFPQLQPFLAGIHCELHICVFQRNEKPAIEPTLEESTAPEGALDLTKCESLAEPWGQISD